jgi:hypothetical protein
MADIPTLIWTAWNNGQFHSSGAGYGFKVPIQDRDRYFDRYWQQVILILPFGSGPKEESVNVAKGSFWGDNCRAYQQAHRPLAHRTRASAVANWPSSETGSGRSGIRSI